MEQKTAHGIKIDNRALATTFGVADVTSFTETEARFKLLDGSKAVVYGEKLQMIGFDKKTGELSLTGKINSLKYTDAGASSPRKFFK